MECQDTGLVSSSVKVILFDLGGVLLRLRDPLATFELDLDSAAFARKWLLSPAVRGHECGELDTGEFSVAAIEEFALPYSPEEFLRRFENWPASLFAGALPILDSLIGKYTLALLSNTNPVHWNRKDIVDPLKSRLRHLFLSHETGYLKPDRQAFGHVIERLGCDPATILFLDDNPLNIDAAKKCGMRAMLTVGIGSLTENLAQVGAA